MRRIRLGVCIMVLSAPIAGAQEEAPLRGPTVRQDEEKSLVGTSMTGRLQRVEGRPEAAAVKLLDLDEETRRRAEQVVADRAMAVTMLLVDEIDTVREITDHVTAGRGGEARALIQEMRLVLDEGGARDPLVEPLRDVLSEGEAAELERLLDEYWTALVDSEVGDAPPRERAATERRLAFQIFQGEVREAYEVSLRRYREALDAIYESVEPTEEQRSAIRDIVIEHIKRTRLSATPSQRRETMVRIYRMLDEDRQERFVGYLLRVVVPDE